MRSLRRFLPFYLAIGFCLVAAGAAFGQEDGNSTEFWPETDIWFRLSPAWRLSSFVALSKNIETDYREGSLIVQADYAFGRIKHGPRRRMLDETRAREMRRFLVRGGYLTGSSLDDQGQAYREKTALLELHFRTPFQHGVLVSHRLRSDLRWLGDDPVFSTRLRYRLMVEKECLIGRASLVPYVNGEAYYDSRYDAVNRVRLIGGASVGLSRLLALEANFTYQHDTRSSVRNLYVLNAILHIYFETAHARAK